MVKGWFKILGITLLLVSIGAGVVWQKIHAKHGVQQQKVMIPHGMGLNQVALMLEKQQVITTSLLFRFYARWEGQMTQIKEGEYFFDGSMSMPDVLNTLVKGDVVRHFITVPEGLRSDDILTLLSHETQVELAHWQAALNALLQGKSSYEGYLLPETYSYSLPLQPKRLLMQMFEAQQNILTSLHVESEDQTRIIASIIEKETALDLERPLVSAVIHNRLHRGMPLQMDPTVIYGIWQRDGSFSGNIHRQDLKTDTPWNTYTRRGLPPTPICNPGAASLRAAAQPADAKHLYFVADGSGGHAFASTLQEHQANVKAWVQLERGRNR